MTTEQRSRLERAAEAFRERYNSPKFADDITEALATIKAQEDAIKRAMEVLENAPCGAIGRSALTLEQLDELHYRGGVAEDDAMYDTMLTAWRVLEGAR